MKKIVSALALLFPLLSGMYSCQKDYNPSDTSESVSNPFQGSFVADVSDTTQFVSEMNGVTDTTIGGSRYISLAGIMYGYDRSEDNFRSFSLVISSYTGEKDYAFGAGASGTYAVMSNGTPRIYLPIAGEDAFVHLSASGNSYTGTVSGKMVNTGDVNDTITISNGSFSLKK